MNIQDTALVTGGAGFIGSHLCETLLAKKIRVICIDNLLTGYQKNISHLEENEEFTFLKADVTERFSIPFRLRYIFHLASPASVVDYQEHPEETALVNTVGTRNVLLLAREHGAKFLFASTSEVYGDPTVHPQPETYWGNVNPNGIRACYDESKRWGEMLTLLYHREYKVDSRLIRIFNTYGPRMSPTDGRVVSNFINQALKNKPMTIYGSGKQTRSFCYVSDLVKGIMAVMFDSNSTGEVYNLGNPEEYTMNELAEKIKAMTGSRSSFIYKLLPADDPERRRPDITKATAKLGWKPEVSLTQGLEKTIAYYQSILR